jgi:hypothetical protein
MKPKRASGSPATTTTPTPDPRPSAQIIPFPGNVVRRICYLDGAQFHASPHNIANLPPERWPEFCRTDAELREVKFLRERIERLKAERLRREAAKFAGDAA